MDELWELQHRNSRLKNLLRELFNGFLHALGLIWFFTYLTVIFILWWGFAQRELAFMIMGTWVFDYCFRKLYELIEKKRDELERLG